jgi:phage shock protein E
MDTKFDGYVFIDVRGSEEFNDSHVSGAVNITVGDISEDHPKLKALDKQTEIVVYCAAGGRANQAKLKLEKIGFKKVINGINKQEVESKFF